MNETAIKYAKEFISKALALRDSHQKEDILRYNQVSYLKLMFDPNTKWVRDHIDGSEKSVHLIRGNRHVVGFVDSCIDSIAIEYERDLRVQTIFDEGFRQVKEYCASLVRDHVDINMIIGILSDTLSWHVYSVNPTPGLPVESYNEDNIELIEIDNLDVKKPSDKDALLLLDFLPKYLGRVESRFVTGANLYKDFGLTSEYSSPYLQEISVFVREAISARPDYFQMVQNLWHSFVEGLDSTDSSEDTYISGYYISNLGKLLCANFIEKRALLSDDNELEQIINGSFFENRGYLNFVEYDYFGWLNESSLIQRVLPIMHKIQNELVVYNFQTTPQEDLFGNIMVQMSERSQRLLLGQELTPQWLAKKVVNKVRDMIDGQEPSFIDMCCGSGSMIIETLKSVIGSITGDRDPLIVADLLTRAATGFDIDPLAVILAKINWIITVRDISNKYGITALYIPIYHADSLFINTPVTSGKVFNQEILRMKMHDRYVDLPAFLISPINQNIFDEIVDTCYQHINETKMSYDTLHHLISDILNNRETELDEEQIDAISRFASDLYNNMYDLNVRGQNGLWSYLIKNSFRPSLITANFNGIVSNTPWLAMSKLASNPYKEDLANMASYYNIKPTGPSFLHLELATVFLIHAIDKFLAEDAAFGCILPETILAGKQHEKFRSGNYRSGTTTLNVDIDEIWNLPIDTFKNRAIAIFGCKSPKIQKDVFSGQTFLSPEEARLEPYHVYHGEDRTVWSQCIVTTDHGIFDAYSFKQGADILPRYLMFFDLQSRGANYTVTNLNINSRYAYFLSTMHKGADYSLPTSMVNKSLFHPVMISNIVTPFSISEMPLAFLPVQKDSNNCWRRYTEEEKALLSRTDRNLISTIKREFGIFKDDSTADIYALSVNWRNKLSQQNFSNDGYLVVYGAGGKSVCASYVNLSSLPNIPVVDQTLYWCRVDTEDEAVYMVALLNNEQLTNSISAFQPRGRFGARHIHSLASSSLPAFNLADESHLSLVRITRQLISELNTALESTNYRDPNRGPIASRRVKINRILKTLPSYQDYNDACNEIL